MSEEKSAAHKHADLVDKVKAVPLVAEAVKRGADLRICPKCFSMYEDKHTPDSVPYHAACHGQLNNVAKMSGAYVASVPLEHASAEALQWNIDYFKKEARPTE